MSKHLKSWKATVNLLATLQFWKLEIELEIKCIHGSVESLKYQIPVYCELQ